MKFGTFDELIRLTDELVNHDAFCESVLRRTERQLLELNPKTPLVVLAKRQTMMPDQYLHYFEWDDARYPRTRQLRDNLDALIAGVAKSDEEVKTKTAALAELKNASGGGGGRSAGSQQLLLSQKPLVEVLTPAVVVNPSSDFVDTAHLVTAVVVVPRGQEKDWLTTYESMTEFVVPRSSWRFDAAPDREGNSLWRVVVFRNALESFTTAARKKRFLVREFNYNAETYEQHKKKAQETDVEKRRLEVFLHNVCKACYSDTLIAWTHLKAIRVFVEAVLRYGVPPTFAPFLLKPAPSALKDTKNLRTELNSIFTDRGSFGNSYSAGAAMGDFDSTQGGDPN
eukprot:Filipodium_phascolosomae@DN5874_c0_g1_i1.p1